MKKIMEMITRLQAFMLAMLFAFGLVGGVWGATQEIDGVTYTAWESSTGLPSEAGNWYLTGDVTLSAPWAPPAGTVNLHLNGKTVTYSGSNEGAYNGFTGNTKAWYNSVIYLDTGRTLNLYDGADNAGTITGGKGTSRASRTNQCGGGVYVRYGAAFNMHGGTISGNTCNYAGGGVFVETNAVFVLSGGIITNNTSASSAAGGHGVFVAGSFTMSDGTICGNGVGTKTSTPGGGVCVGSTNGGLGPATFTMTGGSIYGNYTITGNGGAGVYVIEGSTFTMSGGTISDNYVGDALEGIVALQWDKVDNPANVSISGGIVNGTIETYKAPVTITGGVFSFDPTQYVDTENYQVTANKPSAGYYTVAPPAIPVAQLAGTETYFTAEDFATAFTAEGNPNGTQVIMLADVTSDVTVTRGVSLYLNGYTITGKVTVDNNLTINNKLSLSDGNPNSNVGTIQNTGLDGAYAIYHLGGNLNIGTSVGGVNITATGDNGTALYVTGSKVYVNNGTTINGNVETARANELNVVADITGGTVYGTLTRGVGTSLTVSGGCFSEDPASFITAGYTKAYDNSIGLYRVSAMNPAEILATFDIDTDGYYLIKTATDLKNFRVWNNLVQKEGNFRLANDIDLANEELGVSGNNSSRYSGTFDGAGHTIRNLYINGGEVKYVGFIGMCQSTTVIKDLTFENVTVIGGNDTACIVGYMRGSTTITNCTVTGNISISGGQDVGALIGWGQNPTSAIVDCTVSGSQGSSISGTSRVGGLAGVIPNGCATITGNTVSGVCITSGSGMAGGLAGGLVYGSVETSYIKDNTVSGVAVVVNASGERNGLVIGYSWYGSSGDINPDLKVHYDNNVSESTLTVNGVSRSDQYSAEDRANQYIDITMPPPPVAEAYNANDELIGRYEDVQSAVDAAGAVKVVLLADFDGGEITSTGSTHLGTVVITSGKTLVLDLAGHKISTKLLNCSSFAYIHVLSVHGNLTIIDSSAEKAGEIVNVNTASSICTRTVFVADGASLTMNAGTITATSGEGMRVDGTVVLNEGVTIRALSSVAGAWTNSVVGMEVRGGGSATVNGAKISSAAQAAYFYFDNSVIISNGGVFTGLTSYGVITGEGPSTSMIVRGGYYNTDPSDYVDATSYVVELVAEGEYAGYYLVSPTEPVASTVTTSAQLVEALEASTAKNPANVTISGDVVVDETVHLPHGATITVPEGSALRVVDNGLLLNDGVITGEGTISITGTGFLTNPTTVDGVLTGYTWELGEEYVIRTPMDLQWLSYIAMQKSNGINNYNYRNNVKLANDIVIPEGVVFDPIYAFVGTFDGQGHSISNMRLHTPSGNWGMFNILQSAEVLNLNISGAVTTVNGYVAMLAYSTRRNVRIDGVTLSGTVTATGGSYAAAPFVAMPYNGPTGGHLYIANCTNNVVVSSLNGYNVSVICGSTSDSNWNGNILGVYNFVNNGSATGTQNSQGYVVGYSCHSHMIVDVIGYENNGFVRSCEYNTNLAFDWTKEITICNNGSEWTSQKQYADPQYTAYYHKGEDIYSIEPPTAAQIVSNDGASTNKYETLAAAIDNAQSGDTVMLLDEIELTEMQIIPNGKNITLDLAGHCIVAVGEDEWVAGDALFCVAYGATLTVDDSAEIPNTGMIDTDENSKVLCGVKMTNKGDNSGNGTANLIVKAGCIYGTYYGISGNGTRSGTSVTIEGGDISAYAYDGFGIYQPQNGSLVITDGIITGGTAVYVKSGSVSVSDDAMLWGVGDATDYSASGDGANSTGQALVIDNCGYPGGAPTANITGGYFYSDYADGVGSYASGSGNEPVVGFISGGQFADGVPEEYCADGYIPGELDPETDLYTVKPGWYIAQIGDDKFESLAAAVGAAQSGDTIVMIADFTIEGNTGVTIPADKSLVLDLNGKTITLQVENAGSQACLIQNNGTLTVMDSGEGGRLYANGEGKGGNNVKCAIQNCGHLTVNGGTIAAKSTNAAGAASGAANAIHCPAPDADVTITINGGTLTAEGGSATGNLVTSSAVYIRWSKDAKGLAFTMTDGTLIGSGNEVCSAIDVYLANKAAIPLTIDVSGGELNGTYAALRVRGGPSIGYENVITTITGGTFTGFYEDQQSTEWALDVRAGLLSVTGGTLNYGSYLGSHKIAISGGSFTGDVFLYRKDGTADAEISGGIFGGNVVVDGTVENVTIDGSTNLYAARKFVSGGYFAIAVPAGLCAEGYTCTTRPVLDELYQVVPKATVTYTLGGGDPEGAALPSPDSFSYASGDIAEVALEAATCTAANYTFAGWLIDGAGTAISSLPAGTTGNVTLVASWTQVKTVTVDAGESKTPTIKVTDNWIEQNVTNEVSKATTEKIQEALNKEEANGNKAWENYVLGLNGSDPNAKVAADAAQGPVSATPITSNVRATSVDTGFKVEYRLDRVDADGKVEEAGTAQDTPDLTADIAAMTTETNVVYYKTAAVITSVDGSVTNTVSSTNTVGVLKVESTAKTTAVAVPWDSLEGGSISVSNLVRTATLSKGDELKAYAPDGSGYKSWTLNAAKEWVPTQVIGGSSEQTADAYKVARGSAVWITRKGDTTQPIYLVGGATTTNVAVKVEAGSTDNPSWNLVGSASAEPVDIKDVLSTNYTDKVSVPTTAIPKNYEYVESKGGWGYYDYVSETDEKGRTFVRKEFKTGDTKIPAGKGFWYKNASGKTSINL